MKNSTKRTQNEGTLSALLSATKGLFLLLSLTSLKFGLGDFVALLWEDKPNGAKAHSSGKLKFPSSQPMLIPHRRRKQRSYALPL